MKLGIALGIAVCFSLAAADANEMVPPAGPGVFTAKQVGPGTFKLVVAGHTFTSRGDIEKYLAYRAARLTIEQEAEWFTFKEDRGKGETVEASARARSGGAALQLPNEIFPPCLAL